MKKRFEIFSSKRLRQILNDIKRNSDIAGKELKFPKKQLNRYLKSEKKCLVHSADQHGAKKTTRIAKKQTCRRFFASPRRLVQMTPAQNEV